jgi:hypothetical protein
MFVEDADSDERPLQADHVHFADVGRGQRAAGADRTSLSLQVSIANSLQIGAKTLDSTRAGSVLQNAGLGRAWALYCGFKIFAGLGAYLVKLGSGFN